MVLTKLHYKSCLYQLIHYIWCIHFTCDSQVIIIYHSFVDFINQKQNKEDEKSEQGEERRDSIAYKVSKAGVLATAQEPGFSQKTPRKFFPPEASASSEEMG